MKKPPTDLSKTMTAIRRKLTRYTSLCETHCGYDDAVQKAVDVRLDLEDFIEAELNKREAKYRGIYNQAVCDEVTRLGFTPPEIFK